MGYAALSLSWQLYVDKQDEPFIFFSQLRARRARARFRVSSALEIVHALSEFGMDGE